jgi:ferritin-like protein
MNKPVSAGNERVGASFPILGGMNPQLFVEKIAERLTFERIATRLYEILIDKLMTTENRTIIIEELQKIRSDKARHFSILAEAIDSLGGGFSTDMPDVDLANRELLGLTQIVSDPQASLAQSLHAILCAELIDQAGWDLLIELAKEQQQMAFVTDFTIAFDEEKLHAQQIRQWYQELILGPHNQPTTASLNDDENDTNPDAGAQMQTP